MAAGSNLGIGATKKLHGEGFKRPWPPLIQMVKTLEVINGRIRRRALALVLEWAALHRAELRRAWETASRNQEPDKIEPLD